MRSVITAGSLVTETHYVGAHYERTLNAGNTKYYYIAGQLVAFERSSGYGVDWGGASSCGIIHCRPRAGRLRLAGDVSR